MCEVQILWNDTWITIEGGFANEEYAQQAIDDWKKRCRCMGNPFRVVFSLTPKHDELRDQ